MVKLDKWAEDLKNGLETEIKNLDREIKQRKRDAKSIGVLAEKVEAHRQIKELEKKRNEKRAKLFEEQDNVEARKDQLIDNIEQRLKQSVRVEEVFRVRWRLI